MALRRLVFVRHGETDGDSSVRFHGSGDVPLSAAGRDHMRRAIPELRREPFDVVVASPLRRSWQAAAVVAGGAPVRLESDFREIHFGRWEGLTAEEIAARDPVLYEDWQGGASGFEFPGGEPRGEFRARVKRGLERIDHSGVRTALVVVHKGVIRSAALALLGQSLPAGEPGLGGIVSFSRDATGDWRLGRRGSDPEALAS